MAAEGRKKSQTSATLPPRTLNVKKFAESRAPELEALHSIVSNRLHNDFRSRRDRRRRTTGYDNRITKNRSRNKRKLGQIDRNEASTSEIDQKKVPRRVRRRIELRKNLESGFCTSGDGTKRLRTHLWHAKRFAMTKLWGFHLPLGLQGRGRGSRALLKRFKHGALLHDASYYSAVQLEGPEDSLLSILRMALVPSPSLLREEVSHSVLSGVSYGRAMLHHIGVLNSQLVAPVTYMWRPLSRQRLDIAEDLTSNGDSKSQNGPCKSSFRQLWIWIHAAAFVEGYDALKFACQKLMDETGNSVSCFSREGQMGKLEVMGSKAMQVLLKTLHPTTGISETDLSLRKCLALEAVTDSQLQKNFILEHGEHLPPHAILSLNVHDPRDLPMKRTEHVSEVTGSFQDDVSKDESKQLAASTEFSNNKEILSSLWLKPEENSCFLSDSKDLWEAGNGMNHPLEDSILCMEKHNQRLAFFNLDYTPSEIGTSEKMGQSSRSCSILLLKDSCIGWSIILPLSWVKAFWVPLVSHGPRGVGLREKRWIACDVGLPSFPYDFPECKAYTCFMTTEAATADKKAELRPVAMRPLRVPIPPPWCCVKLTIKVKSTTIQDIQNLNSQMFSGEIVPSNSLPESDARYCESTFGGKEGSSFEGFVARTSCELSSYLNGVHGSNLPLYPDALKDGKVLSKSSSPCLQGRCFRRGCCCLCTSFH
ncbi:ribonucleases P/MRP protein subunit POP1 isoform X1 [Macadamia integrifolia]|uniref:ribonucleases P/MRP protein subunit POP1 isoform X1 n=1 Tax=Macadamia integrifolia TaxID=60698 RepID=UPI001C4EE56D|nr:ribonucleases P/MRP protein subunit POP1 isoform X1 [Macadamia integrifolia]